MKLTTLRKITPVLAVKLAGLLFLFLLGNGLIGLLASFFTHTLGIGGNPILAPDRSLLMTSTAYALASFLGYGFILLLCVALKWSRLSFAGGKDIKFGLPYVRVVHFAGCFVVMNVGLNFMLSPFHLNDNGTTALFTALSNDGFAIFALVAVGPLIEETVFRAGMFRLLHRKIGVLQAMVLSSLLFAIVHGNWAQSVPAFVMGMALALLYYRSDDLRLCYPAHLANNAFAVLGLLVPSLGSWGTNWPMWLQMPLGGILFFLGFIGLMMRSTFFRSNIKDIAS